MHLIILTIYHHILSMNAVHLGKYVCVLYCANPYIYICMSFDEL